MIGGLSGHLPRFGPIDITPPNVFIVAHIHYVFFGGSVITILRASTWFRR